MSKDDLFSLEERVTALTNDAVKAFTELVERKQTEVTKVD